VSHVRVTTSAVSPEALDGAADRAVNVRASGGPKRPAESTALTWNVYAPGRRLVAKEIVARKVGSVGVEKSGTPAGTIQ
jgi:hypothetical protein